MAQNIIMKRKKRRLRFGQQWRFGTLSKALIEIPSETENLSRGFQGQINDADLVTVATGKTYPIGPIQFVVQRYQGVNWHPVDVLCLLYTSLISALLLVFHQNVYNWAGILLTNGVMVIAALELVRLASLRSGNKFLSFLRVVYPAVFLGWGWNALNDMVPMFFGNYWATGSIIAADKFIFGVHPTVWFQQFHSPLLDELMCTFYTGYYLFMPLIILSFFFSGKKKQALAVFSLAAFTYFVNFILFYLFPAVGPQMVDNIDGFGTNNFSGYYVADLLRHLQEGGGVRGAAFPSSHISGAVIWSLATKKYAPKWGNVLLIFTIGVAVSTVYLGYHHALDPIFGFVVGIFCYKVGGLFLKRVEKDFDSL